MAKIFLSVPILHKPCLPMIYSMYQAILSCPEHKVRVYFNQQDSLISRVRNVHMSVFLNEFPECDYFMSLDSDIEVVNAYPNNNIFTKLIAHDKDFVGGLYAIKKPGVRRCSSITMDGKPPEFDKGLIEMRWLSSGCWCIKRSAIEKMVKAYPELLYQGDDNASGKDIYGLYIPMLYDLKEGDFPSIPLPFRKYLSEDWSFPLDPSTNILCDNFKWKTIKNINIGDILIAFDENPINGNQKRQMVKTKVIDKIIKNLPKIKIVTDDGEIITTAEHQWLIKRSYRLNKIGGRPRCHKNGETIPHPAKSYWERTDRLRTGDYIYYPIDNVHNADIYDPDYIVGYLNGMWDGDGCIYQRNKKWDAKQINLTVCDHEIINRVKDFCKRLGIELNERIRKSSSPKHRDGYALDVKSNKFDKSNRNKFLEIYDGRNKIYEHSSFWAKGYMAGIFDSEGNYDGAAITISQREFPIVVKKIKKYSEQLGYNFFKDDERFRLTGVYNVHNFFIQTCPAISRKMHIDGQSKGIDRLIMPQRKTRIKKVLNLNEKGEMICLVTDSSTFIANGLASHNCERWKAIGGKIHADTSIVLKHIGEHNYTLWDIEVIKTPKPNLPPAGFDLGALKKS